MAIEADTPKKLLKHAYLITETFGRKDPVMDLHSKEIEAEKRALFLRFVCLILPYKCCKNEAARGFLIFRRIFWVYVEEMMRFTPGFL